MSRRDRSDLRQAANPVLFFANGHGDHFLNLPAMRACADIFSGRLTVIGADKVIENLLHSLPVRKVVGLKMSRETTGRRFDVDDIARAVEGCDLFISLNPWHNRHVDDLLAALAPECSIGFFPDFKIAVERDYQKHSADLAFDIVRAIDPDLRLDRFAGPPSFPERFVASADRLLAMIPAGRQVLTVHPDTLPEKMWPEEHWVRVIDAFLDLFPEYLTLLVGLSGVEGGRCRHRDRVIPCYGLPIPTTSLIISRSNLFAGVDSCFLHAADMYRIPSAGLFGPTEIHEWGFRFSEGRHLKKGRAMEALHPDEVLSVLVELAAKAKPGPQRVF